MHSFESILAKLSAFENYTMDEWTHNFYWKSGGEAPSPKV